MTVMAHGADDPTRFDALFLTMEDGGRICVRSPPRISSKLFNDPLLGRRVPPLRVALSAHVAERLPDHMRPRRYVFVDRIPTRPGGKVDAAALADLGQGQMESTSGAALSDLPITAMADLWRAFIGCDVGSAEADFFALGGHSLLAARLAGAIRREFGVNLPVIRIFELRTLGAVTREIVRLRSATLETGVGALPSIDWTAAGLSRREPRLSRNQYSILSRLRNLPPGCPHHVGLTLDLGISLDHAILGEALSALAQLHPVLRLRLAPDGQLASAEGVSALQVVNRSDRASRLACEPIDLERDGPFAVSTAREPGGFSTLVARFHPAFFDADSLSIALGDLAVAYTTLSEGGDPCAGRVATDYSALAAWERSPEGQAAFERFVGRWGRRNDAASGAPPPPVLRAERHATTAVARWTPADGMLLDDVAARIGVTSCATLLGCFAMELSRRQGCATIECPVSTRAALDATHVIGPFSIDLPLCLEADRLTTLPESALEASQRLAALFDGLPFAVAGATASREAAGFSFAYQDCFADLGIPWLHRRARADLYASPLWTAVKLSARRTGSVLELRLSWDPAALVQTDAEAILDGLRSTLAHWHASA